MTFYLYLTFAAGVLAYLAFGSRYAGINKWVSLSIGAAFVVLWLFAYNVLTGTPKDINFSYVTEESLPVISTLSKKDVAIWIWVWDGEQPVGYRLPYSEELKRKIHEGSQAADQSGGRLMFNPGQREVHPEPPEPLPEKLDPRMMLPDMPMGDRPSPLTH